MSATSEHELPSQEQPDTNIDAEDSSPSDDQAEPGPPRRRWRRTRIALAVVAAIIVVSAFAIRTPSAVGHWDSAEGQDRFLAAYDEAFTDLPEPEDTLDIRTDFGVVRVYHFAGTGESDAPLVLIPGRASASPVWADNLPLLLNIGDVYTIDLLGEPGKSIQERPIVDDADQATWLDQTLAGLPEEAFHLVGLSIGGWTATNLALHTSAHIASLTLVDPVHIFDGIPVETAIRSLPAAFSWLPKSWRDSFNSYTAGGAPVEDVPVADMIEAGMQHYALKLPQPTRISEEQLGSLDIPTLAVLAGQSVMHDPQVAVPTAQKALPEGNVKVYPDASHAINGEYPDQLVADIAEFIAAQE